MKVTIKPDCMVAGAYELDYTTTPSCDILFEFSKKFSNFHCMTPNIPDISIRNCAIFMKKLYNYIGGYSVRFIHSIYTSEDDSRNGYIEVVFDIDGYKHTFNYKMVGIHPQTNAASPSVVVIQHQLFRTVLISYNVKKDGEYQAPDGYPYLIFVSGSLFKSLRMHYQHKNKTYPALVDISNDDLLDIGGCWRTVANYEKDGVNIEQRLYDAGYFDDSIDDAMREFIWEMI